MNAIATVNRIIIYPVKALDGIDLQEAEIVPGGCLQHDRAFAIKDADGRFVNGKKNPKVHFLRMNMNLELQEVFFKHQDETQWHKFNLHYNPKEINEYLSTFFGMVVTWHHGEKGEFLDIPVLSGITVVGEASLQAVSAWFNDMDMEETRKRFRATIEIAGVPAFWEDRLFAEEGNAIEFSIGDVKLFGNAPRERCVVPSRHPVNGDVVHAFQKIFANQRMATLPDWSVLGEYRHGYFLSVDCYLPPSEVGKSIKVGDQLQLIGQKVFSSPI